MIRLVSIIIGLALGGNCEFELVGARLEHELEYVRQIRMYEDLRRNVERIAREEGPLAALEFTEDIDRRIASIRASIGAMRE